MPRKISLTDVCHEPFRIFFPAGLLAGIIGVALWPLYFWGVDSFYPGQNHPRLMAYGFFGGFILGFLGTALPRMLDSQKFTLPEVAPLALLHVAMVAALALGKLLAGEILFLSLLLLFFTCAFRRAPQRKDLPPPGFVLVALAMLCVTAGTVLAIVQHVRELAVFWVSLQRLLSYQGFVLLPILGISPFLLPRFFGLNSSHDFPESRRPGPEWTRKALLAAATGTIILGTFVAEAAGWFRTAHAVRFLATVAYALNELPLHRAPQTATAAGLALRVAFLAIPAGFLAVALWPGWRVGLLHLTLVGGFAVITFAVATRVVFGHSGQLAKMQQPNRWLLLSLAFMLLGMATRISGDFWPKLMATHYVYGSILWIGAALLWSVNVLPKVLQADDE